MNIKTLRLIDGLLEENEAAALKRCMKEADELEACRKGHPDDQGTDEQKKRVCKAFGELKEIQDARKDFTEEQWHGGLQGGNHPLDVLSGQTGGGRGARCRADRSEPCGQSDAGGGVNGGEKP